MCQVPSEFYIDYYVPHFVELNLILALFSSVFDVIMPCKNQPPNLRGSQKPISLLLTLHVPASSEGLCSAPGREASV